MHYVIVSFSHNNTDIKTREMLSFEEKEKLKYLSLFKNFSSINETIILSTCNRVEIISSVNNKTRALDFIFQNLSTFSGLPKDELIGRADIYDDEGAIHHLFSVASSLDSIVVGETQITGQLKDAFKFSYDNGSCGQKLSRALHYAFKCAASVRNGTKISENSVSVASASVSKAKSILGSLEGYTALVIGTGEMSRLLCKHLVKNGCNVLIVTRDLQRGKNLANEIGIGAIVESFSKLNLLINRYRLLFTATASQTPVITSEMVENKNFHRYWFDIAVPRDIEENNFQNISIYTVDDLKDIVDNNISFREIEAKKAYRIIGQYTVEFYKWLQTLSIEPVIKALRQKAKESSKKELNRAIKKGFISYEQEKEVEKILHYAFNSFLHSPTICLKESANTPEADSLIESLKLLFNINKDETKLLNNYKCEYSSMMKN